MPYRWSPDSDPVLTLWPHRSLPPRGFAVLVLGLYTLAILPLLELLGTALFWGVLPFNLTAVAGVWWAFRRNYRDGEVLENLSLNNHILHLSHRDKTGKSQTWQCNVHWAVIEMHQIKGPVPNYITLTGNGRQVEIGRFLSEDERLQLYDELSQFLRDRAA